MTKLFIITFLFALVQVASLRLGSAAEVRGEPGGLHGGRGFAPRADIGGGRGGGRGFGAGGEVGGRQEHRERGEFRGHEHERHERHERRFDNGIIIGPAWGYYPYYEYYGEAPDSGYYGPGTPPPGYLYYCSDPSGYYPAVTQCRSGWEEVPADEPGY